MRLADSHCHLTDPAFNGDSEAVFERARGASVRRIVSVASDEVDSADALALARGHDEVWCSAGVHPHTVGASERSPEIGRIREVAADPRCVAIGETGLDYHYGSAHAGAQRQSFARHAELAAELDLPLIVHSRKAARDTAAVIRDCAGRVRGVLHCFTGPLWLLEAAMEAGWYVSFTGIVTFPNFDAQLARMARADRYMIETDAPYLAPVPKRGRRNEPAHLGWIAEALAAQRGEAVERVAEDSWRNTARFFALPDPGRGSEPSVDGAARRAAAGC